MVRDWALVGREKFNWMLLVSSPAPLSSPSKDPDLDPPLVEAGLTSNTEVKSPLQPVSPISNAARNIFVEDFLVALINKLMLFNIIEFTAQYVNFKKC